MNYAAPCFSRESAAQRGVEPALNSALPEPGDDERAHSDALVALIRSEIDAHGAMPFARFMERCLYAPGLGYYSAGRTKFGAAGDFVTAPELGSLYARTLAHALAPSLRELGAAADFVELGGGSGAFAIAALRELAAIDALPRRYRILEPSADLAQRQQARVQAELPAELAARIEWMTAPPEDAWRGVLFANEVVDALPTTRFALLGGEVFEEHVVVDGERFRRVDRPADALVAGAVRHVEQALDAPFADGYRSEILPQLPYWIEAISASLTAGVAVFVDYGYPRREFYLPQRDDGTLVCHYRHRAHDDPLHRAGLADITAFVDFTALAEAGVAAGLDFVGYAPQGRFLLAHGLPELVQAAQPLPEIAHLRLVAEAKRLTMPGDMGERFQLIAFSRGVVDALPGLRACDLSRRL
jgi:SAM-dependent MidA family methyltransferase